MTIFAKGDIVYRACILEFEGVTVPCAVPGKIATVNPGPGGVKSYHVRSPRVLSEHGSSETSFSVEPGALFADPIDAMETAIATADTENANPEVAARG